MKYLIKISVAIMMLLLPSLVFAQGGDDPIPGIDIIIKEDPSLVPIKPFSLTKGQIAQYNKRSIKEKSNYLANIVSKKLIKIAGKEQPRGGWQNMLASALQKNWCGPCKVKNFSVSTKTNKAAYKITFKPRVGAAKPISVKSSAHKLKMPAVKK